MSITLLRIVAASACIGVAAQAVLLVGMKNSKSILTQHIGEIQKELLQRNAYVRSLCRKYDFATEQFYFTIRDKIPGTTACVVGKGEKREFLVITKELPPPTFKL